MSEYDVLEPPLGLIALLTYLNKEFNEKIRGKIIKSRIDFDSYEELNNNIKDFEPDIIGVSAMTFHKDFFHQAINSIRENGFEKTIVVGGPYPTTSYKEVLEDKNIDMCVIGEGEATLSEIIEKFIKKERKKLSYDDLINLNGIAFSEKTINNVNSKHKLNLKNNLHQRL